ncbi:MAG: proteasome-type protease [Methyloversatilis sp.]|jgi:putative proteasome-type protease|uniref:proteasome-type protease n=1 Tax=Methyloversatilis TaxID=378210 RepID=UPI00035CC276|nr:MULTISPECIES: proteasome-type protease [Methyloversatilis]MCR6667099.1 proteasome-type protease [Methyloversatilis sp.]PZU53958.1 MAG: peptidase [Thauera sp.]
MTYCVGMLLDAGLVCLSDSRTNAGVDHINTFRKMNLFERPGERVLVLMSAGNLALTQTLVSLLRERLATDGPNLYTVTNMFEAARHVGDCLREVHARDAEALKEFGIEFNASLILGGQILGEEPRLFQIYAAGNFIEATRDTPYFQIGEAKYGKPIIDRVIRPETTLDEAAKCALISMDSTIRSNLSVGLPLDLLVLRTGALKVCSHTRIDAENAYFEMIRTRWGESLREAFHALPSPDWIPPA